MALLVPDTGKLAYGRKRQRRTRTNGLLDELGEARLTKERNTRLQYELEVIPYTAEGTCEHASLDAARSKFGNVAPQTRRPTRFGLFPSRVGWPRHFRSSLITQSVCWTICRVCLCSPGAD